jgi:hypothetical protein
MEELKGPSEMMRMMIVIKIIATVEEESVCDKSRFFLWGEQYWSLNSGPF